MFSRRLVWNAPRNRLTTLLDARRSAGASLLDLTVSNPTTAGFAAPTDLLGALADPRGVTYRPDPRGLPAARVAIAAELGVDPDRVVLTASTSEAYSFLLKLLCDPGDEVLVPTPSYPLFDYLLGLEGVVARRYRLAFDGEWHLDFATLEGGRARAILVVSPNNPTGSTLKAEELARLEALGLPLVVDEVFAPYADAGVRCAAKQATRTLTFSLGGLSKGSALPQLKLGWIVVGGPDDVARDALDRLETIADSYLSVSTPVQLATPRLLEAGQALRDAIAGRLRENRAAIAARVAGTAVSLLPSDGGWSAILRCPAIRTDEDLAVALLEQGVLVQPGYFFDLEGAHLVVSLLTPPAELEAGLATLVDVAQAPVARSTTE